MLINSQKYVKKPEEIQTMRKAGKILGNILKELENMISPNIKIWDLEERFLELTRKNNVVPSCKDYAPYDLPPFPTGLCVSVNNQSVHCFPKKNTILRNGDIVTIDTDIGLNGLYVDSAFSKGVGDISDERSLLLSTTKEARDKAIKKVKAGIRVGVISHTIQKTAQAKGFDVIREYAGHGIGKEMHEFPEIPCFGNKSNGPKLRENMTICIEPLICAGNPQIEHLSSWETKMADNKDFCQFEHTVLVKKDGYEILTEPDLSD
ncbi:type I methionyl aminopeptidase [Patescibacteria group bacterium]|nr:type I methionyl aminopeptidase [Patescibacteria group bacterium]